MNKNEKEYIEQYPKEENPYKWFKMFTFEEIDEFVSKRNGKKVLCEENYESEDTGTLYYSN